MHNSRLLADDVRTAAETGMTDDVIDGSPDFYRNRNSGEMAAKVGKGGSLAVGVTDILHSSIVPNLCGVVASIGYMCYYVSPALASASEPPLPTFAAISPEFLFL